MSGECENCSEHSLDCKCDGWTYMGCLPKGSEIKIEPVQPIESIPIPEWVSVEDECDGNENK